MPVYLHPRFLCTHGGWQENSTLPRTDAHHVQHFGSVASAASSAGAGELTRGRDGWRASQKEGTACNGSFSVPITNNERAHVPLHPQRTTPNNARKKTRAADADAPPRKISPGPRSPEYVLRNRERARRILGREGAERRGEEVIDRGMHSRCVLTPDRGGIQWPRK